MTTAWILATGTELSTGLVHDSNSAWLAAQLAALGIRTTRMVVLPDDPAALVAVLQAAPAACDVVLMTGGLGPTADDHTRDALALAAGVELVEHAPSVEHLRLFFAARGRAVPAGNLVQALVPRGAHVLRNTCGSAPGLRVAIQGVACYALPSVPSEMRTMFQDAVASELRSLAGGRVLRIRTLHTIGLGESEVGTRLRDLMAPGRNPGAGTSAGQGLVHVRLYTEAASPAEADRLLDQAEADVRSRLGAAVFGVDGQSLAEAVGHALLQAGRTVSTAESCTGGLIGALITDVPGSSRYYRGGVNAYANEVKIALLGVSADYLAACGAVSREVAQAMADGIRRTIGTDYGISVTGIAGPGGGTIDKPVGLVFIGVASPAETVVREFRFGSDAPRDLTRARAAYAALNELRLLLAEGTLMVSARIS